jgi:hypothetical protein
MANNMEASFCSALGHFRDYPNKEALFLFPCDESENRVLGYSRQFRKNIGKLFDEETPPIVPIRDFRANSSPHYDIKKYTIKDLEELSKHWPGSDAAQLQEDPYCRLM